MTLGAARRAAAAALASAALALLAAAPALANEGGTHLAAPTGAAPFMMPVAAILAVLTLAGGFILMASAVRGFRAPRREDEGVPAPEPESAR